VQPAVDPLARPTIAAPLVQPAGGRAALPGVETRDALIRAL
jgi:hypothetical protein